ncbi:hypothetical protein MASR1M8_24480 [Thermomonas brevis]
MRKRLFVAIGALCACFLTVFAINEGWLQKEAQKSTPAGEYARSPADAREAVLSRGVPPPGVGSGGLIASTPKASLAFESALLEYGGMSTDAIGRIVRSGKIDTYVDQVQLESMRDAEASALSDEYRRRFLQMLDAHGDLQLGKLACGLSLCVGTIVANGKTGDEQYTRWLSDLDRADAVPTYSFVDGKSLAGDGGQHWFFFSVDPSVNAVHTRR